MFVTTSDQEYILSVLKKTKVMRKDQAIRLLKKLDAGNSEQYVERSLGQLRHIRKIIWETEAIFVPPILHNEPIDRDMLSAIDIMLDLTDSRIHAVSAKTSPYTLCFFIEQKSNLGSYAVIVVSHGSEAIVTASLCGNNSEDLTVLFLLSDFSQRVGIHTSLPHFFAIHDGGRYRYFKGGD